MSNVASDYPARREVDSRGERVWFKAAVRSAGETWGWTCDPTQAHPDYQVLISSDGSATAWVGDFLSRVPDCDDPDRGAEAVAAALIERDRACIASCEQNCPPRKCLWSAANRKRPLMDLGVAATMVAATTPPVPQIVLSTTTTTTKGTPMTELAADGTEVEQPRFTEWMRYPLPPRPERAKVTYDGYGRYKLPSPSTGRPTGFTRSTTVAKTLEETYNLSRWSRRQAVKAVLKAKKMAVQKPPEDSFDLAGGRSISDLLAEVNEAISAENDRDLDKALDMLDNLTGGADARELGEAVHAWLEAVDVGTVLPRDVPELFAPYVSAYRAVLARHGLVAVAEYVERIVLNDRGEETIVGTIDRIYRVVTTGALVLGDVKTSKTLEYSWLPYSVQFAVYGYSTKMLSVDGQTWEPMPEIDLDACYCLHVPSDQPERAACITFDLYFGGESMIASLDARARRKKAAKAVPFVHEIPVPSKEALRYVAARDALLDAQSPADLGGVWEKYQEVWTDDLTALGEHVAELLDHADASATA